MIRLWFGRRERNLCARCDHPKQAHQHYRKGTDCSQCPCPRYRRVWIRWSR